MVQEVCIVSDPVMLHVWTCLHNYAYDDAVFAAERLFAETQSSESLHLLATSLYRIGRPKQASRLLCSATSLSPKCRYLLSKCNFDFGLLSEAEDALLGHSLAPRPLDELTEVYGEQAAYAILLLGNIRKRQGKLKDAILCYKKALDINPMLWTAFKNLCDIGEFPDPSATFQLHENLCFPTPLYEYVCNSNENIVPSDKHSAHQNVPTEKNDTEEIVSRENVNPQTQTFPPTIFPSAKTLSESQSNASDKTFLTHYFKPSNFSDIPATPAEKLYIPSIPEAPKAKSQSKFGGKSSCGQRLPVEPKFGHLALKAQSPMFACVPIFHMSSISPAAADTFYSGSSKSGNHTLPLRHSALNESVPASSNLRVTSQESPSPGNVVHRLSRYSDHSEITQAACNSVTSNVPMFLKAGTERTTTSTPACNATSLRRLVIADSPNVSASLVQTNLCTSNVTQMAPSNSRCDPPVLRSASQRSATSGKTIPQSRIHDIHSTSPISPSCGSRGSGIPQSTCHRLGGEGSQLEETHVSGPRTRSQVAAAVALARASGVQRRSDRASRSKLTPRKVDSKQPTKAPKCDDEPVLVSSIEDSSGLMAADPSYTGNVTFGEEPHSNDVIAMDVPVMNGNDPRVSSLNSYLHLLSDLGKSYQLLVQHNWRSATRLISKLPFSQLSTGRILSWAARAHLDNADYVTARKLFSEVRRLEPWQLVGMDFYSTVLWQLQADHELSLLAHELLQLDRNAPEPWCAAGNCFSLQGEHEVAIRFLQRAIQVCPTSAYAFTLLGHEQSTLEDFDRALNSFRHALRLDPRQYNALFGMSNVYYKQERFELADSHLSRAVTLFPKSHLLLTNLGALRGRLGHLDGGPHSALALVTKACKIQPNNPLARYHRSSILFHLGRYTEVLTELQKLLMLTPREAMVYLMIGHTHKKLGNTPQAMIHYSWAMGLDPKGANTHLRDIMTNPPVVGRSGTRYPVGAEHAPGIENGTRGRRVTRSQLAIVPGETVSDDDELNDDASETDPDFLDTDLQQTADDTMSGFLNSNFPEPLGTRDTRRLTDFSVLFGTEALDEPGLSGMEDEDQHETMDLGGELDDNNQSVVE